MALVWCRGLGCQLTTYIWFLTEAVGKQSSRCMSTSCTNLNATTGPSKSLKDGASISSVLLAPLNELQSLSHTLFLSLSPIQSKPPPPPPPSSFLACDEALSSAITLARTHQTKQRKIDALEKEILDLEARWREIVFELDGGRKELEEMIEEGEERVKAIEQAKKSTDPSQYIH
jgi:hypothetical protein